MLKPIVSKFECSDELLGDLLSFLFLFDAEKIKISDEYLLSQMTKYLSPTDRSKLQSKMLLDSPFMTFYKYLNQFIDSVEDLPNLLKSQVDFGFNRKVVWDFISYISKVSSSIGIKSNVVNNRIKNNELYLDSERFVEFVEKIVIKISEAVKTLNLKKEESITYPLTLINIENVFFLISKFVMLMNFIKIHNQVYESIDNIITTNEVVMDSEAISNMYNVIDEVGNTSYESFVDDIIIDEDNYNVEIDNLDYPVVPVVIFKDLRLFQEKRVFLFVAPSNVGKSMLLSHIATEFLFCDSYKKAEKEAVFYFTMENLKQEVTARIYANALFRYANVNRTIDDVVGKRVTSAERSKLGPFFAKTKRLLNVVYLPPKIHGVTTLRNLIKKVQHEKGAVPYGIIVDFVDKMKAEKKGIKAEHEELGQIIDELKALASEMSAPVVSVSHLNAEGCKMAKEDLTGLGGGQVGKSLRKFENTDVVAFMDEEDSGLGYSVINFFFAKHRYYRKLSSKVYKKKFLPEYSWFGDVSSEELKKIRENEDGMGVGDLFARDDLGM